MAKIGTLFSKMKTKKQEVKWANYPVFHDEKFCSEKTGPKNALFRTLKSELDCSNPCFLPYDFQLRAISIAVRLGLVTPQVSPPGAIVLSGQPERARMAGVHSAKGPMR